MGAVLTAELIAEAGNLARFRSADALASAAGMAPVLRQSGRTRFLRRPTAATRASNASSTSPPSARLTMTTAEPSTNASDARVNATTKPSLPRTKTRERPLGRPQFPHAFPNPILDSPLTEPLGCFLRHTNVGSRTGAVGLASVIAASCQRRLFASTPTPSRARRRNGSRLARTVPCSPLLV